MTTIAQRRQTFRDLHERGCFALPNPWDIGTARYLQGLGFPALASTSAGFAFSRGLPDYGVPLEVMLAHIRELVEATDLPLNADFANGYAHEPEAVAANARLCADTGVAGLSIEDNTGNTDNPLYEIELASERIRATADALAGTGVILVARAECFLVGREDLDETIRRLVAYAEAGADCLYAPGISERDEIRAVVNAVAPKPVNILLNSPGLTMDDAAELGVRRVSVGSALAGAAWGGFIRAAKKLAEAGSFEGFGENASYRELNSSFTAPARS